MHAKTETTHLPGGLECAHLWNSKKYRPILERTLVEETEKN